MLAWAGSDSRLPQLRLHYRPLCDHAFALIVYVRRVSYDSQKLRLRTLTGSLVCHNCPVGHGETHFSSPAEHRHPSLLKWPKSCLGRLSTSFESSLSTPSSLGSTSGFSLVLTTVTLWHRMTRDVVSGFAILTVP